MEEKKEKVNSFLLGLSITLGTIVVGLISYIVFTSSLFEEEILFCEYSGGSYSHGESFDAIDGCNICSCNSGLVVCTSMICENDLEEELQEDQEETVESLD